MLVLVVRAGDVRYCFRNTVITSTVARLLTGRMMLSTGRVLLLQRLMLIVMLLLVVMVVRILLLMLMLLLEMVATMSAWKVVSDRGAGRAGTTTAATTGM